MISDRELTRVRARVHGLGSDLGLQGLLGPQATCSEGAWEGKVRLGEALHGLLAWLRIIYGLLSVAFRAGKKAFRNRNPREIAKRNVAL